MPTNKQQSYADMMKVEIRVKHVLYKSTYTKGIREAVQYAFDAGYINKAQCDELKAMTPTKFKMTSEIQLKTENKPDFAAQSSVSTSNRALNVRNASSINDDDLDIDAVEIVDIIPGQSIGDLKLGMTRQEVFQTLGREMTALEDPEDTMEFLDEEGLRIEYDNNQVSLLESDGTWPLFLEDFNLFGHSYSDCRILLQKMDPNTIVLEEQIYSKSLGIAIMGIETQDMPPYLVAVLPKQ